MNRLANYKDDEIIYVLTTEDVETAITEEGINRADLPSDYLRHVKKALEYLDWSFQISLGLDQAIDSKKEEG
jgi:hypothetical protein